MVGSELSMKPMVHHLSCDTAKFGLCGPLQFLSLYKPEVNHNVGWGHNITVSHAKQLQTAPRRMPIYFWLSAMKEWPNEAIWSSWCWRFLWHGQLEVHLLAKYLWPKGYLIQVPCLDNSVVWSFYLAALSKPHVRFAFESIKDAAEFIFKKINK